MCVFSFVYLVAFDAWPSVFNSNNIQQVISMTVCPLSLSLDTKRLQQMNEAKKPERLIECNSPFAYRILEGSVAGPLLPFFRVLASLNAPGVAHQNGILLARRRAKNVNQTGARVELEASKRTSEKYANKKNVCVNKIVIKTKQDVVVARARYSVHYASRLNHN